MAPPLIPVPAPLGNNRKPAFRCQPKNAGDLFAVFGENHPVGHVGDFSGIGGVFNHLFSSGHDMLIADNSRYLFKKRLCRSSRNLNTTLEGMLKGHGVHEFEIAPHGDPQGDS
jgi:hypothetical protein